MRTLKPKGGIPIASHTPSPGATARATKSRHGCRRCKQRRRKCGEEKPQCKRCVEDQVQCPGYAKDFRWSSKYEVLQASNTPASSSEPLQTLPTPAIPALPASYHARPEQLNDNDLRCSVLEVEVNDSYHQEPALSANQHSHTIDEHLSHYDSFFTIQELDLSLMPSVQSLDSATYGSVNGIASATHPFLSYAEDDAPSQVPISTFGVFQAEEQDCDGAVEEVVQQTETALIPTSRRRLHASSGSIHAPEDLLRWYYRMTPTQYSDSDLVEHYFSQVCRLYALFDSTKNPFRALVGHNWDSSGSIALAIQSMSCAHLANSDSAMVHVGLNKQRQARISIHNDLQLWRSGSATADRVLLAILLLGPTVSWHNAGDIGLEYLTIARELINAKLTQPRSFIDPNNRALEQFFMHAMIYWEMMISFVDSRDGAASITPISLEAGLEQLNLNAAGGGNSCFKETIKPHPWTGIAPHVQILFADVGRVMRRRVRNAHAPLATQDEVSWAMAIEKALIATEIPTREDVLDSGDLNTPEDHFVQLAGSV